ncbi:phosphoesterase [Acidipila sp. EB88]|uniref:phosphoesterase n=1 Tax=Acidipila sp. EB88 TaxID=2305226 RepID=UPI000F5FA8F0|nr:phosphoesterase [Acidipila sp. EB88]RRA47392.1 phosphoesterase [Acidipila sp. EB88]
MTVRVFYHGNCFDGACSAALFTRFHRERIDPSATYEYQALMHRAGSLFDDSAFTGDENAIVDFKYSPSPRVTWWFDHHLSAFLSPEDHASYEQGLADPTSNFRDRRFYDPHYTSCTSFIADTVTERFGFDRSGVASLVHWADIVDGALYESAQAAVEMREAAMRLTLVIESTSDDSFVPRLIPLLGTQSLEDILEQPFVAELLPPLLQKHREAIEIIRERAKLEQGTIFFDLADRSLEGYNKFIPYYLHPEATYSVGLSRSSFRTKVAVGTNPWTPLIKTPEKLVNLAAICERYGGGGHARVGAISFPPDRYDEAKEVAAIVVAELRAADQGAL